MVCRSGSPDVSVDGGPVGQFGGLIGSSFVGFLDLIHRYLSGFPNKGLRLRKTMGQLSQGGLNASICSKLYGSLLGRLAGDCKGQRSRGRG